MKPCERCGKYFVSNVASRLCEPCWEDLGQMSFWQDDEEDSDDYEPPIDTVFDREEEARGYM